MFLTVALPTVIMLAVLAVFLLVIEEWRVRTILLALLYLGIFILSATGLPIGLAVTHLLAGWTACIIVGMAIMAIPSEELTKLGISSEKLSIRSFNLESRQVFQFLSAILVVTATYWISPQMMSWIPGSGFEQIWGGLMLIALGITLIGFNTRPFPVTIGLLIILGGFLIIYSIVESSTLITGLLAVVIIGLGLVGAYIITVQYIEE